MEKKLKIGRSDFGLFIKNGYYLRVNNEINGALNQIERNRYYTELIENKIKTENIIKIAIVFTGKEPYINEIK